MGTKTIRLDDEAYERLATRKREEESFSDVIKRLAGERSLLEVAGILSEGEAAEMREAVAEVRDQSSARADRVARAMGSDDSADARASEESDAERTE